MNLLWFICLVTLLSLAHAQNDTSCDVTNLNLTDNESKCAHAKECPDEDALINWLEFHYCTFDTAPWASIILQLIVLSFLFYLLGQSANRFFIPTLEKVSDFLHLTPSIAGVTLLAFGNGAADIFTNFAAVNDQLYEQSLGQLLGAGLFVTLVVVGSVSMVSNAQISRRPFLRDAGFLTISIAIIFVFLFDFKIELWEAIICLVIYVVFVGVVVLGRVWQQRNKVLKKQEEIENEQKRLLEAGISLPVTHPIFQIDIGDLEGSTLADKVDFINTVINSIENNDLESLNLNASEDEQVNDRKKKILRSILNQMDVTFLSHVGFWGGKKSTNENQEDSSNGDAELVSLLEQPENQSNNSDESDGDDTDNINLDKQSLLLQNQQSTLMDSRKVLMPPQISSPINSFIKRLLNYFEWKKLGTSGKIQLILSSPILLMQHLTIHWAEDGKYFRWFYVLQPPSILTFVFFVYQLWSKHVVISGKDLGSIYFWVLPISIILSVVIFRTTRDDKKPAYETGFMFGGLVMSVIWISFLADQLVAILSVLGEVLHVPSGIMGLTVLAWGNSISDFVSNISVARRGLPEMAIAASYSAPLTNLLLGLGLALTVNIIKTGKPIILNMPSSYNADNDNDGVKPDLTNTIYFSFVFLLGALLITLLVVPFNKFNYRRPFGIFLVIFYVLFLVISLLALNNVIFPGKNLWLL